MQKYFGLFAKAFKVGLTYRSMAISQFLFAALGLAIQFSLWHALMQNGAYQGITFRDMVAYLLIGNLMGSLVNVDVADTLELQIKDGSVISNLIRPVSFKGYLTADALGRNVYRLIISAVPLFIISSLIFGLAMPPSFTYGSLFLASAVLGMLLMIEINFIVGFLAFVVQRTWYLNWYVSAGMMLFGGAQIPLWFFPNWLYHLSYALPFRYVIFEPMNLYLGKTPPGNAHESILIAFGWLVFLWVVEALAWRHIRRRLTVNGG